MPFIPKFPEACRHLDLGLVRRTLVKHRANITAAAKELKVSRTDLRRLTWHDPKLLKPALEMCDLFTIRCTGVMIKALYSRNRRRREWGVDKILASPLAAGCPLAPAPKVKSTKPPSEFILEMRRRAAAKRVR